MIVSSSDSKGGAARIAETLVNGLRARHHDVTFLVGKRDRPDSASTVMQFGKAVDRSRRGIADRAIHRLGINHLALNHPFPAKLQDINFSAFDIVHLHDVPGPNLRHLPWLGRQCNLVWTIHSMLPITGNCIYAYDCDRWKRGCGNCPQFGEWPLSWLHRDGSSLNMAAKRWIYLRSKLNLIGVSEWITNRIRESAMSHFPVTTVQNAVDLDRFHPVPNDQARAELGIPPDDLAIAFSVAANPEDRRKGVDIILTAAEKLSLERSITFMPMSIGAATEDLARLVGGSKRMLAPRHLESNEQLRKYYSAADVIWHPSRADTSSMVSMEAMACGTPVIAAAVGGVPEVIGTAGFMIPPDDPDALVEATRRLVDTPGLQSKLSTLCLSRMTQHFSLPRFIDDHEAIYASIIQ